MPLRDIADARALFGSINGSFVGVGMTAFSRITPAHFIPSYRIVCHKKSCDLDLLKKTVPVFSLEELVGEPVNEGLESVSLISHPMVRELLAGLAGPVHLILYQNYPALESIKGEMGWRLAANPSALRLKLADRRFFREMIEKLALPAVPGAVIPLGEFLSGRYGYWSGLFGKRYVVQLVDIIQGGGRGTFFVTDPDSHLSLCRRLEEKVWRGVTINYVSLRSFIEGEAASIALCVTKNGILVSRIQRQVIDAPYCDGFVESGIFCGHSWDDMSWGDRVNSEAKRQSLAIGNYLAGLGYRGICGIDILVDGFNESVFVLELNPRYTGAFPMLSLLQMDRGILPMEAVHLLELLSVPYSIDIEALNEAYMEPLRGGHLIVFVLTAAGRPLSLKPINSGLYELSGQNGNAAFLRECASFNGPEGLGQFVVLEGPPNFEGRELVFNVNLARLCRLMFSSPITDARGRLSQEATAAARWAYKAIVG